ncbi:tartrate-resistant acid phosphatase type 5 [Lingula anatina]|uniref:Tartrate-resistant acid phosphatase type 5 n=1 Tax=Lingula anatina TaxID=7574 RepID=A0A1S3J1W2_LINAN|nr:tartrate-resistant acid phosphatase type 5 [Lingula anatina]|eukprot:XP_013404251.1 tartrate-resistant acid phosphatase type 5 [Lingula anatina]
MADGMLWTFERIYVLLITLCFSYSNVITETAVENEELNFLVVGDWGGQPHYPYSSRIQRAVAKQLGKVADEVNSQFVISVGDNIYFRGVRNVEDVRFKETFEDVFTHDALQTPWYVIPGNHDHRGNISAQILYTHRKDTSGRWYMPDHNYTITVPIGNGAGNLTLIMLDTIVLCGNTGTHYEGEPPLGPADPKKADAMWQWIEETLKSANRSTYVVVAGHFPTYSIGYHGPTTCLRDRLHPLLHIYKVNAYLCGHDHNLQDLSVTDHNWTVNYFVIGFGALVNHDRHNAPHVPHNSSKFFWSDMQSLGGFGLIQVTLNSMNVTIMDSLGKDLHHVTIFPRVSRSFEEDPKEEIIRIPQDWPIM